MKSNTSTVFSSQHALTHPLRSALLTFCLAAASSSSLASGTNDLCGPIHGWFYTNEVIPQVPWSIHVVRIDRSRRDWELCTTLGKGDVIGMGTVSAQIQSLPCQCGQPLAAINGDFYEKKEKQEGRPRDLQIRFGEVITSPAGHTCFWMAPDGTPHMGNIVSRFRALWPDGHAVPFALNEIREDNAAVLYTRVYGASTGTSEGTELVLEATSNADWLPLKIGRQYLARVRAVRQTGDTPLTADTLVLSLGPVIASQLPALQPGATVRVATETTPDLTGVQVAIGGGPSLVEGGQPMQWHGLFKLRHPRTAVGWNNDYIFLVEVDGRQMDVSLGMTLPELAAYMLKIGSQQAMNLDGGGSATLWAFGMVKNSPSEGQERPAPNALVLLQKPLPVRPAHESSSQ